MRLTRITTTPATPTARRRRPTPTATPIAPPKGRRTPTRPALQHTRTEDVRWSPAVALAGLALGCFLTTTRPGFDPLLGAPTAELRMPAADATERLAEALRNDSIPVARVEARDGYLETAWFDGATGRPISHSPLG